MRNTSIFLHNSPLAPTLPAFTMHSSSREPTSLTQDTSRTLLSNRKSRNHRHKQDSCFRRSRLRHRIHHVYTTSQRCRRSTLKLLRRPVPGSHQDRTYKRPALPDQERHLYTPLSLRRDIQSPRRQIHALLLVRWGLRYPRGPFGSVQVLVMRPPCLRARVPKWSPLMMYRHSFG